MRNRSHAPKKHKPLLLRNKPLTNRRIIHIHKDGTCTFYQIQIFADTKKQSMPIQKILLNAIFGLFRTFIISYVLIFVNTFSEFIWDYLSKIITSIPPISTAFVNTNAKIRHASFEICRIFENYPLEWRYKAVTLFWSYYSASPSRKITIFLLFSDPMEFVETPAMFWISEWMILLS